MPIALPLPTATQTPRSLPPLHAVLQGEDGPVTLQGLRSGTRLCTRAGRSDQVIWLGRRRMTAARLAATPRLAPVLIRRGALGRDNPARDLLLSPEQPVHFSDPRAAEWFGTTEICVAAVQLTFIPGVEQIAPCEILYVHPILATAHAISINGLWIGAGRAADPEMTDPASPQRKELLQLFPELVTLRGWMPPAPGAQATAATASG